MAARRTYTMRAIKAEAPALAALGAAAALMAGCGEENTEGAQKLAPAGAIEADPYTITCGHVRDQQAWADVTRRATVASADRQRIPGLNRLQATQSLFFAMTQLCRRRPVSYEPTEAAVDGVPRRHIPRRPRCALAEASLGSQPRIPQTHSCKPLSSDHPQIRSERTSNGDA
jgi:hypothetical protein